MEAELINSKKPRYRKPLTLRAIINADDNLSRFLRNYAENRQTKPADIIQVAFENLLKN